MAEEGLQKRLQEIDMTSSESKLYESVLERVGREIAQLRVVLQSAETRAKERQWLKHQTTGELDDAKLIDGVTGERLIYKRRGEAVPLAGAPPPEPRRLHFVLDVSGSMYRFNSQDGRLNRVLETAVLVMEGFRGFENKFEYRIVGHSGDTASIGFVPLGQAPENQRVRLGVVEKMVAHSQFCWSGDHTLEATQQAIAEAAAAPGDEEQFVFVVSDANLQRYGIPPKALGKLLTSNPKVKAFAIFIASLSDEATRLSAAMPAGRGFVCMDTAQLPALFRSIFTSQFAGGK